MDNTELIKSQVLENHARVVMEMIDVTIIGLDNAENVHQKLLMLGMEHKARDIKLTLLDEIRGPFLLSVEQTLGDRYSERIRAIYECFIDYMLRTIKEGYNHWF